MTTRINNRKITDDVDKSSSENGVGKSLWDYKEEKKDREGLELDRQIFRKKFAEKMVQ